MQDAAPALGITVVRFLVDSPAEIDLPGLAQMHANALYVSPNAINAAHYKAILAYAATNQLPAVFGERWSDFPSPAEHHAGSVVGTLPYSAGSNTSFEFVGAEGIIEHVQRDQDTGPKREGPCLVALNAQAHAVLFGPSVLRVIAIYIY
jgi:hypothetical protein